MKKSMLGIEQLGNRIVMTAGLTDAIDTEETKVRLAGGWGMAQYQYSFEGCYGQGSNRSVGGLTGLGGSEESAIVFVGGYGASMYQYANETTYDPIALIDSALSKDFAI